MDDIHAEAIASYTDKLDKMYTGSDSLFAVSHRQGCNTFSHKVQFDSPPELLLLIGDWGIRHLKMLCINFILKLCQHVLGEMWLPTKVKTLITCRLMSLTLLDIA